MQFLPNGVPGVHEKRSVLLSVRDLDRIVLLNIEADTPRLVWEWGSDVIERPHHASLLENGNILLFDNGFLRKWSRVVEMNPTTGKIVWEYSEEPKTDFFSPIRGAAQRLRNGNTLISHGMGGRVFEVTPEKDVVWDYYLPVVSGKRLQVYRAKKLPLDHPGLRSLEGRKEGASGRRGLDDR